ncbi:hypothetical protein GGR56DRAFT_697994 [Xylariaceae sp. FL0804]|nr:hypothetical protein GGR56DRAFT_697994 [Xylariaceae sp. FL0804]
MAHLDKLPTDFFLRSLQYTKTVHTDVYPAIDPTRPELSLAGKVVAFAPAYAKAGVLGLALLARGSDEAARATLDAVAARVRSEIISDSDTRVLCVPGVDVRDAAAVADAFARVREHFGRGADILVNNAGLNADGDGGAEAGPARADPEKWWEQFEVNARGTFLVTREFLRQLPSPSPSSSSDGQEDDGGATVLNLTTGAAWKDRAMLPGHSLSKLVAQEQVRVVAAHHPNVTAVALHPGLQATDMLPAGMRRFDRDTPELAGGAAVWLSGPGGRTRFLSGRVVACHWDVDELTARRDEIKNGEDLTIDLLGKFGPAVGKEGE